MSDQGRDALLPPAQSHGGFDPRIAGSDAAGAVTLLLGKVSGGDIAAMDRLFPVVHRQLRRAAEALLQAEPGAHTLHPTALVQEAYLRLIGGSVIPARDRSQFLSIAARAMREIVIAHARRRRAERDGAGDTTLPLEPPTLPSRMSFDDLLALDGALDRLSAQSARLRSVVELRFFGGLDDHEIAETLAVPTRIVQRDWVKARAWLYRDVYGDDGLVRETMDVGEA